MFPWFPLFLETNPSPNVWVLQAPSKVLQLDLGDEAKDHGENGHLIWGTGMFSSDMLRLKYVKLS